MFRCELKFDESKVQENGYTMDAVHQIVDKIFQKIGVPKISEGIYVDKDSDDSNLTMETTFRLLDCPVVVHFCNYWRIDVTNIGKQFDILNSLRGFENEKSKIQEEAKEIMIEDLEIDK